MIIKCSGECPLKKTNICCSQCVEKETCTDACNKTPSANDPLNGCDNAVFEEDIQASLLIFQNNQAAIIKSIANICTMKKKLDEDEKQLKEKLKAAMEINGVKSFDNEVLKITYIAATTSTSVDSKKLKANYPEIYKTCSKPSSKSAYVKVEVK